MEKDGWMDGWIDKCIPQNPFISLVEVVVLIYKTAMNNNFI